VIRHHFSLKLELRENLKIVFVRIIALSNDIVKENEPFFCLIISLMMREKETYGSDYIWARPNAIILINFIFLASKMRDAINSFLF